MVTVKRIMPPGGFKPPAPQPTAAAQPKPAVRGFRPPAQASVAEDFPPTKPLRESLVTIVQMKRLHALGRDVGLDHAALKAIAAELQPGLSSGGMATMTTVTWSRVMARLADRHGANVRDHERRAGDEADGHSAFVTGLLAEMERTGVAAQVRAAMPGLKLVGFSRRTPPAKKEAS